MFPFLYSQPSFDCWNPHLCLAYCIIKLLFYMFAVLVPYSHSDTRLQMQGFPGGSDGKEPVCNVGDPGSIPGSVKSPGEGNGYPLQYSCLENSVDGGAWQAAVHGVAKSQTRLRNFTFFLRPEVARREVSEVGGAQSKTAGPLCSGYGHQWEPLAGCSLRESTLRLQAAGSQICQANCAARRPLSVPRTLCHSCGSQ